MKANQPSILVVDDDATQARCLKERLELEEALSHARIDVATGLSQSRQRLSVKFYSAAITDWHCPFADDGRAVIKDLRSQGDGPARAIAVLSGAYLDEKTEPELQNVLVLHKPLNGQFNELVQFLASNLDSSKLNRLPGESLVTDEIKLVKWETAVLRCGLIITFSLLLASVLAFGLFASRSLLVSIGCMLCAGTCGVASLVLFQEIAGSRVLNHTVLKLLFRLLGALFLEYLLAIAVWWGLTIWLN